MTVLLEIKVNPSSGKQLLTRDKSGMVKCFLKNPPEDGKANAELIKFLAKQLEIPQDQIKIILGASARKKVVKIDIGLEPQEVFHKLGIEIQSSVLKR